MKKIIYKGVIMVLLLVAAVSAAYADSVTTVFAPVARGGSDNYVYTDTLDGTRAPQGCFVQIIESPDNVAGAPDSSGVPAGDTIKTTTYIGSPDATTFLIGEFYKFGVNITHNAYVYVRVWNASTVVTASKYGTSALTQVISASQTVKPASMVTDTLAPSPAGPIGFIGAAEGQSSIRWSWTAYSGADRYDIYTSTNSLITATTIVNTLEGGLTYGNNPYSRYVKAHLGSGQTTGASNTYTAYTLAITPDAISAKGGWNLADGYFVTLTWEASNSSGTVYEFYGMSPSPHYIDEVTTKLATERFLNPNESYTYYVRAINGNGIPTEYSNYRTATTPPAAPTLSTSAVTTNEITWQWTAPEGATTYILSINGSVVYSGANTSYAATGITPCTVYNGSVVAVNTNGQGAPGTFTRSTLPEVPVIISGTPVTPRSVQLTYTDANVSLNYEIQVSLIDSDLSYVTKASSVASKTALIPCDNDSTLYYFRVRARNGDGVYSAYSTPQQYISGSAGGGSGVAPTILNVKFNDRSYRRGEIVSSTPRITVYISGEVDTSYKYVIVDYDTGAPIILSQSDITIEPSIGNRAEHGDYTMHAICSTPIAAQPVQAHKIKIQVMSKTGGTAVWDGEVAVMSGKVQVIGTVYNYPNPFHPLSADPSKNTTRIAYNLNVDSTVALIIYDISGHEVKRITSPSGQEGGRAGINQVVWDGRSLFQEPVGNGMYIYQLISKDKIIGSGKLVIID